MVHMMTKLAGFGVVLWTMLLGTLLQGAEQGIVLKGKAYAVDTFAAGVRLFANRDYVLAESPKLLTGMNFLRSPIEQVKVVCEEPGMLYALSPTPTCPGAAHQATALRAQGFASVDCPEFQLFGRAPIDQVLVYGKKVAKGEELEFGKWVLLLGPGLAFHRTPPKPWSENDGELLYNGIRLPKAWPPNDLDPFSREVMRVPYLACPPKVIRIDVGRQLFVDDFLITSTSLEREFHKAEKYEGNPVLKPETALELNGGHGPVACPFSDGVFFDPKDKLFKMWYHAGWFDGTAYATSTDGLRWQRPELDVVEGTNRVVAPREDFRRDGVSVWLDQETREPAERFKMFLYARSKTYPAGGRLLTSPDGIHWTERTLTGPLGDNTTYFYNPFRKKWVFSIRTARNRRQRDYWESDDFLSARDSRWTPELPVYWCGADDRDLPDPKIKFPTQLYKLDAVGYESLMLGLMNIHYGPENDVCAREKYPKLTEIELAFSRDGFHWDRTCRDTFIGASRLPGDWQRGYIHSVGGCCLMVGDKLYFYYGAFSGVSPKEGANMYAGASTGVAFLRRDGFASMNASTTPGTLTTRPVSFTGKHLFVNLDAPEGTLRVEILDDAGRPIEPFTQDNCEPVVGNATRASVRWRKAEDLSSLAGRAVQFRFTLKNGKLYAFWVSPDRSGASHGFVAAGGPGFTGPTDTVGQGTKEQRKPFDRP
jgi:hypothetical protein